MPDTTTQQNNAMQSEPQERMQKIAIIDLGAFSMRLVLVKILNTGNFVVFDEMKENVALGQGMENNFLSKEKIQETVHTMTMFKTLCDANDIKTIYAYATSGVRQARNQSSFIHTLQAECGIDVKVLTPEEEARFIYQGVINSMDIPKGLIVDIGGTDTLIIEYCRKEIRHVALVPYGAVNLKEAFFDEGKLPEERVDAAEEFFLKHLNELEWLSELDEDIQLIGVGGSFRLLGKITRKLTKYPLNMAHNYQVPKVRFDPLFDHVKVSPVQNLMRIGGMSKERAIYFPYAMAMMSAIETRCGFSNIVISGCGLREGVMFSVAMPITNEKPINDVLTHSINGMLAFSNANIQHAKHVYEMSMCLFRKLKVLHRLNIRSYSAKILRTAALLHDIGTNLKYYDHQNHSCYYILNSNLFGISQHDLMMSAFVAAGHRDGNPFIKEFDNYKDLFTQEEKEAMAKMSVILKIAESFDRTQSGIIKDVACEILGEKLIMKTNSENNVPVPLEIKDAMKCAPIFYKVFEKKLEILNF